MEKNIVIGVSGASGIAIAAAVLERLQREPGWRSFLVMTKAARRTAELEYAPGPEHLMSLADVNCAPEDLANSIASGTDRKSVV